MSLSEEDRQRIYDEEVARAEIRQQLEARRRGSVPEQSFRPGVAALLSLVIPGAGQMYRGHIGRGLLWLVCVVIGYAMLIAPGVVLHIACIFCAASGSTVRAGGSPSGNDAPWLSGRDIAIGVGVLMVAGVLISQLSTGGKQKPNPEPVKPPSVEQNSLQAAVSIAGTMVRIRNADSFDWTDVRLECMPTLYRENAFYYSATRIRAGSSLRIPMGEFRTSNGDHMDFLADRAATMSIRVKTADGRDGLWKGGFTRDHHGG